MRRAADAALFLTLVGPLGSCCPKSGPDLDPGAYERLPGLYTITYAGKDKALLGGEIELTDTQLIVRYTRDATDYEIVYDIGERTDL